VLTCCVCRYGVDLQVWDNLRKILLFNLPVNFAQGTSIFWAYVIGFHVSPLTAIQVSSCVVQLNTGVDWKGQHKDSHLRRNLPRVTTHHSQPSR
jgi:hypothetical protein